MADSDLLRAPARSASLRNMGAGGGVWPFEACGIVALTAPTKVILFPDFPEHPEFEDDESDRRQDERDH